MPVAFLPLVVIDAPLVMVRDELFETEIANALFPAVDNLTFPSVVNLPEFCTEIAYPFLPIFTPVSISISDVSISSFPSTSIFP